MGLSKGILFDEQTYGAQKLVAGYNKIPWEEFAAQTPMNDQAKADLIRLWTDERDYMPGLSLDQKMEILRKTSYYDFLKNYVKVDQQVLEMFRRWGMSKWCVGIEEIPATLVQSYDAGMAGLEHTLRRVGSSGHEPYIFHFPDGNASVARLIVRSMLPDALPGSSMEDVVTARLRYSMLDRSGAPVRIRLNSTVVNVAHTKNSNAVDVTFVHHGNAHTVRGKKCIMACYNMAIPYLCPELPQEQVEGLRYGVKIPLSYTKVLVRNWRPFAELGLDFVYYTNDFFKTHFIHRIFKVRSSGACLDATCSARRSPPSNTMCAINSIRRLPALASMPSVTFTRLPSIAGRTDTPTSRFCSGSRTGPTKKANPG